MNLPWLTNCRNPETCDREDGSVVAWQTRQRDHSTETNHLAKDKRLAFSQTNGRIGA
jgi:hypothetical protein